MRINSLIITSVLLISACNNHSENNKQAEESKKWHDTLNVHNISLNNTLAAPDGMRDSIGGFFKMNESEKKESFEIIELDQGCKLVLNSNIEKADSLTNEILNRIGDVMLKIQKLVPADNITIDLKISKNVIPNFGVGGIAFNDNETCVRFDPEDQNFKVIKVIQILVHEIHHVVRLRMLHKETSPLELLILEGLADHFMVEALNCEPPPWSQALTEEEIQKYFIQVKPLLHVKLDWGEESGKWFEQWFLGRSFKENNQSWTEFSIPNWSAYPTVDQLPRYTGYSLGWRIVENYLKAHPKASASNLVLTPAEVIVNSTPELLN